MKTKQRNFKKVSNSEVSVHRLCTSPAVVLTPVTITRHFQPHVPCLKLHPPSPKHCYKCYSFVKTNSYALYN